KQASSEAERQFSDAERKRNNLQRDTQVFTQKIRQYHDRREQARNKSDRLTVAAEVTERCAKKETSFDSTTTAAWMAAHMDNSHGKRAADSVPCHSSWRGGPSKPSPRLSASAKGRSVDG